MHYEYDDDPQMQFNKIFDKELDKWNLEFVNGVIITFNDQKSNKITVRKYNGFNLVPKILFHFFSRLQNLYFLIIIIIQNTDRDSSYYDWVFAFSIILSFFFFCFKEIYSDRIRKKFNMMINNQTARKANLSTSLFDENLGSIIKINKNERCPADIILLDTSEVVEKEAICFIDTSYLEGFSSYVRKKACSLTQMQKKSHQKNNFAEYRKLLSGKLEYQGPISDLDSFKGFLKLKHDPKVEQLSIENFISRGCALKASEWIIGMVIYNGKDTKLMLNSYFNKIKKPFFEHMTQIYFIYFFMIIVVMIFICLFMYQGILLEYDSDDDDQNPYDNTNYLILLSPIFPIELYEILDFIYFYNKFYVEKKIKSNPKYKNDFFNIVNYDNFTNLCHSKYALLSKTGILTENKLDISQIFLNGKMYLFENLNKLFTELKFKKSEITPTLEKSNDNENKLLKRINIPTKDLQIETQSTTPNISALSIKKLKAPNLRNIPRKSITSSKVTKNNPRSMNNLNLDMKFLLSSIKKKENSKKKNLQTLETDNNNDSEYEDPILENKIFLARKNQKFQTLNLVNYKTKEIDKELNYIDFIYGQEDFKSDYENLKTRESVNTEGIFNFQEFFETLVICHFAKARLLPYEKEIEYESERKYEETILNFARNCGYVFERNNDPQNPNEYYIAFHNMKFRYKIIGINHVSNQRKILSLVYKNPFTGKYFLVCCGNYEFIKGKMLLKPEEEEKFENILKQFLNHGLLALIYLRRELIKEEAEIFKKKIKNLKSSLINQSDQLEKLAEEMEVNLQLVCIIGLKDQIRQDAIEMISFFKSIKMNMWVLSGDVREKTIFAAYSAGIIELHSTCFSIIGETKNDLLFSLKSILSELKGYSINNEPIKMKKTKTKNFKTFKTVFKSCEKHLLVNGMSIEIIFSDQFLKSNFIFICSLINTVIGYRMSPYQKMLLTRMIQKDFDKNPSVLAIGDSYNDILMLQEADFGAEIVLKEIDNYNPVLMAGDIQISNLMLLKELMIRHSLLVSDRVNLVIYLLFYKSFLIGMQIFLFNFYSRFSGTTFFDPVFVFLYYNFFFVINIAFLGILYQQMSVKSILTYPKMFIQGECYKITKKIKNDLIYLSVEGSFQSLFIFYFTIYITSTAINHDGMVNDKVIIAYVCMCSSLILCLYRITSLFNYNLKSRFYGLIFLSISLILFIFFLSIRQFIPGIRQPYEYMTLSILDEFTLIMNIVINVFICLLFSHLIKYLEFLKSYKTPFEILKKKKKHLLSKTVKKVVKIERILNIYHEKKKKLITLIKKIFRKPEWLDDIVQEMIGLSDINAQEIKINKYTLEIYDSRLEKKYIFNRKKKSIRFAKVYLALLLGIYTVYLIFSFILYPISYSIYIKIVIFVLGFGVLAGMFTELFSIHYSRIITILKTAATIAKIIFDWIFITENISLTSAILAVMSTYSMNFNVGALFIAILNTLNFGSFFIRIIIILTTKNDFHLLTSEKIETENYGLLKFDISICLIILVLFIILICQYLNYRVEKQKKNEFLAQFKIDLETKKVNDILSILVPHFVILNLEKGKFVMEQEFENVSIIFCDIYDFDNIINTENKNIIHILDRLYRFYDSLCVTHGIQKIETVGKTYMAASGLRVSERGLPVNVLKFNKTVRLLNMAFDILKFVENVTYGKGQKIMVKIGIHTGKVIAGVIGYHKPQFSLIGDTVNTTSRVCSTSEVFKITVSEEAMIEARSADFLFLKKVVKAKGKGDLVTYQVSQFSISKSVFRTKVNSVLKIIKDKKLSNNSEKKSEASSSGNLLIKITNYLQHKPSLPFSKNDMTSIKTKLVDSPKIPSIKEDSSFGEDEEFTKKREKRISRIDIVFSGEKKSKLNNKKNVGFNELEKDEDIYMGNFNVVKLTTQGILLKIPKNQKNLYDNYLKVLMSKHSKEIRMLFLGFFLVYLIKTLILISMRSFYNKNLLMLLLRGIFNLLVALTLYILEQSVRKEKIRYYLKHMILGIYLFGILTVLLEIDFSLIKNNYVISFLELMIICLVYSNLYIFSFANLIFQNISLFAVLVALSYDKNILNLEYFISFFCFICFNIMKISLQFKNHIHTFNKLRMNEAKRVEQEDIVSQLLPLHTFEKLKHITNNSKQELIDYFQEVTILFADIANFTKYSASVKPSEVVLMLRELFTEFDKMCVKHCVYKLYTIGDCYVVMGLINASKRDPITEANNVVKMGMSMIQIIRKTRKVIGFDELDMRIGIHTGSIIGGIIGTDIVRYDMYGKDVLIANRMESNGVIGNIMVSESTKKMLEKDALGYRFEKVKDVEVRKGESTIPGFFIFPDESKDEDLELE